MLFSACTTSNSSNIETANVETSDSTSPTKIVTERMKEIREILIGDWLEDSIEFKRVYPGHRPPPVQNTRVRYQEDGYVYIPGVLLTKEHWDTWEIANDSTLHIIKRQDYGTRVFFIDTITPNMVKYRLQVPEHKYERKIKLLRIK